MRVEYTCSMITCDIPLGPRTGSNPAGSAEKAAFKTPPRFGAARAADVDASINTPAVAAIIAAAAVPARKYRRLTAIALVLFFTVVDIRTPLIVLIDL
jgi:hypothetical protein